MRKGFILFCLGSVFILHSAYIKAQQAFGQIVANVGIGYSPGFDGQVSFISQLYPIGINTGIQDAGNGFICSSILPNIGGTIDFGISKGFSIGITGSYQNETVDYALPQNFTDKVSRTNVAFRFLLHLCKTNNKLDDYLGFRFGASYWHDTPSPDNVVGAYNYNGNPQYIYNTITFLQNTSSLVGSFQILYGLRLYTSDNIGLHFEIGIGSPYLAEGGITFRINTRKSNPYSSSGTKQDSYGGHPINK